MKVEEMIGKKFGKITVLGDSGKRASNGGIILDALCDCGNKFQVDKSNLTRTKYPTCTCGKCSKVKMDIKGKKFGLLTALDVNEERTKEQGYPYWDCLCDCGNTTVVSRKNLVSGQVKSCGCLSRKDNKCFKPGDRVGKLVVIEKIDNKEWYKCKCDCGVIKLVQAFKLKKNLINSCGNCNKNELKGAVINNWLILEQTNETNNGYYYKCKCVKCGAITRKRLGEIKTVKGSYCSNCHLDNSIIGQKFSKLTVLEQNWDDKLRRTYCTCLCDCGQIVKVQKDNLKNGNTKSCGCLKSSGGELQIRNILETNNIEYETQKTFTNCLSNKGFLLRFDFYLPEYNVLIEYDGQQHFKEVECFNETLKEIQERDEIKNSWCKNNHITLIRIPYYDYDKINLNYLIDKIEEEDNKINIDKKVKK